jgi:hypothetical protein
MAACASGVSRGTAWATNELLGDNPKLVAVSSGSRATPSRVKVAWSSGILNCSHQDFIILENGEVTFILKRNSLGPSEPCASTITVSAASLESEDFPVAEFAGAVEEAAGEFAVSV